MPKITIRETDLTSGGAYLANENVVYIPGFSSVALTKESGLIGVPTLCTSLSDFEEKFGASPKTLAVDTKDKSYVMAHELLKLGMYVLYEVPATTLGGTTAVATDAEMVSALKESGFWTRLADRGLYDIRFVTSGAYGKDDADIVAISTDMLAVSGASGRGDAVALIDHVSSLTTKTAVQSFFDTNFKTSVNAKFGAGFTPWIHLQSDFDLADKADKLMPGSVGYLMAFAQSTQLNPSWLAVAGASRGRISGLVAPFVSIKYGEKEADALNTREEGEIAINPICNINPYGVILWGNRTLNPVGLGTVQQSDLVASNFLNIRNLVCSIKKVLYVSSRGLTFEQNSDILWINFKAGITPLLDRMVSSNGIADYRLIKKKSDKKATLTAIIRIVPIEAVEDFDLTIEMSDSVESVSE